MGPLREVSLLFLKLGCTAFGGPPVHIAMMRREVVDRRRWLSDQAFLDLIGATNLIPGPNSTEMAIHLGYLRAGPLGLVAAGTCFIVPPMLMVLCAAWAYTRYGSLPAMDGLLYGVKPVVVALVLQALWNLGRKGLANPAPALLGAAALAAYLAGLNEIGILAAGGVLGWAARSKGFPPAGASGASSPGSDSSGASSSDADLSGAASPRAIPFVATSVGMTPAGAPSAVAVSAGMTPVDLSSPGAASALTDSASPGLAAGLPGAAVAASALPGAAAFPSVPVGILFLKFLKIGAVLYGSGYVLLPFLKAAFCGPHGPLTEAQILDAVAVGQVTPGPFFTTATFIGYLLGGVSGGLLATLGIFLPAFVFVALTNPWIPRLRASRALGRVLDGVNAASLGLMAGAAWELGRAAVTDWTTAGLGAGALLLLFRNTSSTWLIASGGLLGIAARLIKF